MSLCAWAPRQATPADRLRDPGYAAIFASSRKRWRPRTTASGASAGPSTRTSSLGASATRRRAYPSAACRSPAEMRTLASRPNGGYCGLLAQLDLARIERVTVSGDQRAHHRMFGLVGLQITDTLPGLATGAADDLMQQLEGALRRPRIAVAQAKIRIDDADQIELREDHALWRRAACRRRCRTGRPRRHRVPREGARPIRRDRSTAPECGCRNSAAASCSKRSTPGPTATNESAAWHCGHCAGGGIESRSDGRRAAA